MVHSKFSSLAKQRLGLSAKAPYFNLLQNLHVSISLLSSACAKKSLVDSDQNVLTKNNVFKMSMFNILGVFFHVLWQKWLACTSMNGRFHAFNGIVFNLKSRRCWKMFHILPDHRGTLCKNRRTLPRETSNHNTYLMKISPVILWYKISKDI